MVWKSLAMTLSSAEFLGMVIVPIQELKQFHKAAIRRKIFLWYVLV